MKHNPFNTIAHWLSNQKMTLSEKKDMREILLDYATTHPVTSGLLSPYTFRYMGVALASLVLVLGTSVGITNASLTALPNQSLYGVKIWIEEFQASNQKDAASAIAFETGRIKKRFDEASTLAMTKALDDTTSQVIQSGLEHSRESVRRVANLVLETQPELALQAINNLETTFSSNGRILATIEKNTQQQLGTIVLAAEQSVERLALEKVKFEQIVALQPNSATRVSTEQKLTTLTEKLKTVPEITNIPETPAVATAAALSDQDTAIDTQVSDTALTTASSTTSPLVISPTLNELVAGAKEKILQGSYSEALVTLQQAEQVIDKANLTKSLEQAYNLTTSD